MQEIQRENLVPGKEYYLQSFEPSQLPPNKPYKMIAKFKKLKPCAGFAVFMFTCFTNFRNIEHKNDSTYGYYVELNLNWRFYEIAHDKVQKNMEKRAYNMVLLKIVNDEYFTPINLLKTQ